MSLARSCLPRCFDPVSPDECFSRRTICCIQWTAGDGNVVTWDASVNMQRPSNIPEEQQYNVPDWKCYCQRSHKGAIGVYGWRPLWEGEPPPNQAVYSRYDDNVLLDLGVVECFKCTCGSTVRWPDGYVAVDHWARDLVYWDGDNYAFPDYPGWPGFTLPRGYEWADLVENAEANGLFVAPGLRWLCEGVGPAAKIRFYACWHVAYFVTDGPFAGEAWSVFIPYATGVAGVDWWYGDPGQPIPLTRMGDGWPDSEVQPLNCNYGPCGDPLDCFVSCISGSENCDGMTPAHVPVIYLTLVGLVSTGLGCCFVGTWPLRFGASGYGYGYGLEPFATCVDPISGAVYTMKARLSCTLLSGDGGPSGPGGPIYLIIEFLGPGGSYKLLSATVTLSCTDGTLNDASGTFTGTGCGLFGAIGWAISL